MSLPVDFEKIPVEQYCQVRGGLPNTSKRLDQRKPLRLGFFGTSVTNGEWPNLLLECLQTRFSGVPIQAIRSSIGGSDSQLGVYRLTNDLLVHKPDLVFVEFVNDMVRPDREMIAVDVDAIVGQIHQVLPETDVVLVYVPHLHALEAYDRGALPVHIQEHERVACRRAVSSIDLAKLLHRFIRAGGVTWEDYSGDIVHPGLPGHTLLAQAINRALDWILHVRVLDRRGQIEPLDAYSMTSRLVPIEPSMMQAADSARASTHWQFLLRSGALTRDEPERHDYYNNYLHNHVPSLVWLDSPGDRLVAQIKAQTIGLYDLHGPDTGTVTVEIDGQMAGCFDRFIPAGRTIYRLSTGLILARFSTSDVHHIQVTLTDKKPPTGMNPTFLPAFWMIRG